MACNALFAPCSPADRASSCFPRDLSGTDGACLAAGTSVSLAWRSVDAAWPSAVGHRVNLSAGDAERPIRGEDQWTRRLRRPPARTAHRGLQQTMEQAQPGQRGTSQAGITRHWEAFARLVVVARDTERRDDTRTASEPTSTRVPKTACDINKGPSVRPRGYGPVNSCPRQRGHVRHQVKQQPQHRPASRAHLCPTLLLTRFPEDCHAVGPRNPGKRQEAGGGSIFVQ